MQKNASLPQNILDGFNPKTSMKLHDCEAIDIEI